MKDSIFARLLTTFLVAIVFIVSLGVYMYNWSLKTVKNEIINSSTAQVSFYLKSLEQELERIKILQYDSLNDEYLAKLAIRHTIMNEFEIVESMRNLQQRLVTINNSSSYISNVRAHILPIGKTISSRTSVSPMDREAYERVRIPWGDRGAQIVQYNEKLYLTTLHTGNSSLSQLYMIDVELNTEALKEALGQFHTYADSGSFLIDLTNHFVIKGDSNTDSLHLDELAADYRQFENGSIVTSQINGKKIYVIPVKSEYLNMILVRYIPQEQIFIPLSGFYIWLWVFTGVGLIIMILYTMYSYNLIHKPMQKLVRSFRRVESGDFNIFIAIDNKHEFRYLYQGFNSMVKNLSALIDQVYKQKILNQKAELKQLQSQISPHFLYNSLFMINTMAKLKDDNLIPYTKLLGEYFQFITRNGSDFLPLHQEIEHARTYTEIQLMRFSMRLSIEFAECPEAVRELSVPRLIIQPIIENAFKYAVEQTKAACLISICFEQNDDHLLIQIADSGTGLTDMQLGKLQALLDDKTNQEVTGLMNIHRRIQLIYGGESGLSVARSSYGGLQVTLRLCPRMAGEHHV